MRSRRFTPCCLAPGQREVNVLRMTVMEVVNRYTLKTDCPSSNMAQALPGYAMLGK